MVGYSFTVWNEEGMRGANLTNLTKEEEVRGTGQRPEKSPVCGSSSSLEGAISGPSG